MQYYVYIAVAAEQKIMLHTMDPKSGQLTLQENIALEGSPGPLCMAPEQRYLYAGLDGETPAIASFSVDTSSGSLTSIGRVDLKSDSSCYLATDKTGKYLLSAYYSAGMVSVHPIGTDGVAHDPAIEWRDTAHKAHYIETDASNRYAFVPHVGESNAIHQFLFDANTGKLTPNAVPKVDGGAGQGPRHLAFHPTKDIIYADNEQESSVTVYHFDSSNGTLTPDHTVSTLPAPDPQNSNAQIRIHPSGKTVYASNRGHDSIAVFAIDPNTGAITSLGQEPTEGIPRPFNIDPSGNFLFAGGQATGRVASYRIQEDGTLSPLEIYEVGKTPSWILPLQL
jgi:6-phosphogluconolactonase